MISASPQAERSCCRCCWSVMLWFTASPKVQLHSRLKRQHGQYQARVRKHNCSVIDWLSGIIHKWTLHVFIVFLQTVLQEDMASFETRRYFIVVSTLMTWTNFRISDIVNPKKSKSKKLWHRLILRFLLLCIYIN